MEMDDLSPKPLVWIGSTREDLKEFPEEVRGFMGHALYMAQCGLKHERAKPLKGFGSAGVVEIVRDLSGDTYRAVYTVRLRGSRVWAACVPEEVETRQCNSKG